MFCCLLVCLSLAMCVFGSSLNSPGSECRDDIVEKHKDTFPTMSVLEMIDVVDICYLVVESYTREERSQIQELVKTLAPQIDEDKLYLVMFAYPVEDYPGYQHDYTEAHDKFEGSVHLGNCADYIKQLKTFFISVQHIFHHDILEIQEMLEIEYDCKDMHPKVGKLNSNMEAYFAQEKAIERKRDAQLGREPAGGWK